MRLEIICQDRLGITQDVLDILVEHNVDLRGIEIDEAGKIYLHFPNMEFDDFSHLMPKIRRIDGISDVKTTPYMPGERERQQLSAILQTLPDPVFSVDTKGSIITCNSAALATLEQAKESVEGEDVQELIEDFSLVDWLNTEGIQPNTRKVKFIQQDYLADLLPVFVPDGTNSSILAGAVIMFKSEMRLGQQFKTFHHNDSKAFEHFTVQSPAMKKAIKEAQHVADLDAPVVLLGEVGTGKHALAKACHEVSRRANEAFLVLKCDLLPEQTIDRELFGYADGQIKDYSGKAGLLELGSEGVVFLDEVGSLPLNIQAKLSHAIDTKKFTTLGSDMSQPMRARLICSTTKDLDVLVQEGKFSQELYYQLNVLTIAVPPLRDRKQDVVGIAEKYIIMNSAKLGKRAPKLSKSCVDFIQQYPWPGNVRQLHNALYRAISLSEGSEITKEAMQLPSCAPLVSHIDENFDGTLDEEVKKFERDLLRRLYPSYPSTRQLAKKLGLSHTAIANKLREYGINKTTIKL
jgi:transcriptional regulator of aroF, aroG, tyrA and aromatic amino acid transport